MVWRTKQTAQSHTAGMHNMCDSRNAICHLEVHFTSGRPLPTITVNKAASLLLSGYTLSG